MLDDGCLSPDGCWTRCSRHLAALYRAQRKYDLAEPPYKRSLAILEKTLPLDYPHRICVLHDWLTSHTRHAYPKPNGTVPTPTHYPQSY